MDPVRCLYGRRTGPARESPMFFLSYGPIRDLQECHTTRICKNTAQASYGARLQFPNMLFTGCLRPLNPYGARELIMHALKFYVPYTGRQNSFGAVGHMNFVQNSPSTAREQPVWGPGVWCDWGITRGVTIHRCIGESYRNCQRYANRIVSGWIDSHDISSGGRNQAIKCPWSQKIFQIHPTKCRMNVMGWNLIFSMISYCLKDILQHSSIDGRKWGLFAIMSEMLL